MKKGTIDPRKRRRKAKAKARAKAKAKMNAPAKTIAPANPKVKAKAPANDPYKTLNLVRKNVDAAIRRQDEREKLLRKLIKLAGSPEERAIYKAQLAFPRYKVRKVRSIKRIEVVNEVPAEIAPFSGAAKFSGQTIKHRRTREEWFAEYNPQVQDHVIIFIESLGVLPPEDMAAVAAKIRTLDAKPLEQMLQAWSPENYKQAYESDGITSGSCFMEGGIQQLINILGINISKSGQEAIARFDEEYQLQDL